MNHLKNTVLTSLTLISHFQKDIAEFEIISKMSLVKIIIKDEYLFPRGTKLRHIE